MEIYKNLSLEDLPNEEWRDVVGYEGLYQVSNMGRVKSLKRESTPFLQKGTLCSYTVKKKICKQSIVEGYLMVHLSKYNIKRQFKVHRLVAIAFIENRYNHPQINHLDEDKLNNVFSNLEWCTSFYNNNYGTRNERISKKQLNDKTKSKRVIQYTIDGKFVKEWDSICEIGRHGFDRKSVSCICRGVEHYHTSGGYKWSFK